MAQKATSYDNNQVIVDKIKALRLCISRRNLTLQKKIKAGVRCDTMENVKLTLIAYLLEDYQKNAEDDKAKDCLQLTASEKKGYKLINSFIAYVERENVGTALKQEVRSLQAMQAHFISCCGKLLCDSRRRHNRNSRGTPLKTIKQWLT